MERRGSRCAWLMAAKAGSWRATSPPSPRRRPQPLETVRDRGSPGLPSRTLRRQAGSVGPRLKPGTTSPGCAMPSILSRTGWARARRRRAPLPPSWLAVLEERVAYYGVLPPADQAGLRGLLRGSLAGRRSELGAGLDTVA